LAWGIIPAAMTLAQEVKRHDPTAHVEVQDIFEAVTPNHYQAFMALIHGSSTRPAFFITPTIK